MVDPLTQTIRVLVVEDIEADAQYAMHHLRRAGVDCEWRRVETAAELSRSLHDFEPDLILSDFSLPQFDGMSALRVAQEQAPDTPFMFLSGTIGEERAIAALHAGAVDYVLKENMARLPSAVRRAITEAASRRERMRQEAQIARLNRVLRMLSGVNGLVLRTRDRIDLLRETCRLAVSVGGYTAAIASANVPGFETLQPVAWHGADDGMTAKLRDYVAESPARSTSVIARAIQSGREFVCNDTGNVAATSTFDALMLHAGMRSVVALPLLVDNTAIAMLVLTARDTDVVGDEELNMLREVAGNLSFGLQYLQRDTTARFLSHFDPQTGLAKRPLFCERVQRLVSGPAGQRAHFAVVVIDIARLSVINDSFGRRTGDLLLQHVADRLKRHYPGTDQIAHFGGGTFALVKAQGSRTEEDIVAVGKRQDDLVFGEPFQIEGRSIPLSIVAGFALCPEDGEDATTLVQNAEAALRHARIEGRKYAHYSEAARSQSIGQLALEHQLRLALEKQEFELCYQPKCNVFTRCIEGAEALIRWRHPENGLVYPGVFLPVLESTGLIVQVGEWVIRRAAEDLRSWIAAGLPPVRVAVNIAPAQLRHPDFEAQFRKAAGEWPGLSSGIDIEITEGVLQDDSEADVRKLYNLRQSGVKIAIDDFGTGYSSLSRIASLPIDTLKIDRRFVNQALGSFSGASLVKTIIALARTFNMTTVAEGVEKPDELEFLRQSGCDQSQGFLHSQAVPADAFAQLLMQGKGSLVRPALAEDSAGMQFGVRQPAQGIP